MTRGRDNPTYFNCSSKKRRYRGGVGEAIDNLVTDSNSVEHGAREQEGAGRREGGQAGVVAAGGREHPFHAKSANTREFYARVKRE